MGVTMLKFSKFWITAAAVVGLSNHAFAGEISLMKGFYQSSKERDGLESTNISLGARYLDSMGGKMAWYVDFSLGIKSYSAPSNEPGNQTDINGGGGVRMKMPALTEKIIPYIAGGLFYKSETTAPNWSPTATTWNQESGLFYGGALGLHFLLATDFFMDLESNLFTSALAGKVTNIHKTPTGETKGETDSTDLFVDTTGAFDKTTVALGLKF
jgi:hypothetical protein